MVLCYFYFIIEPVIAVEILQSLFLFINIMTFTLVNKNEDYFMI